MAAHPIAEHTDEANAQHYEVPAASSPPARPAPEIFLLLLRSRRDARRREERWRRPPSTPTCTTASDPGARLRLGLAVAVDGEELSERADHRGLELATQRDFIVARPQERGLANLTSSPAT